MGGDSTVGGQQEGMSAGGSPFENDMKRLFSAGMQEIEALFKALKERKDAFSTADMDNGVLRGTPNIITLKQVFIYLVDAAHGNDKEKRQQTMERILSLGITKEKADHFFALTNELDVETMNSVTDLLAAMFYHAEISLGTKSRIEVTHTFLAPNMSKMVPTVSLQLTNIKENQTLHMRMDADEFSVFAKHVSGSLDRLKQESKDLKDSLGDRYIRSL